MKKKIAAAVAILGIASGAWASDQPAFGQPVLTAVSVSFGDGSTAFRPDESTAAMLEDAHRASIIYVSGRTSTPKASASDEGLALRRALSARQYLVSRGVSPLKIMVNFASATDFIADNSTAEGRRENQRVDVEVIYVPTLAKDGRASSISAN